MKVPRPFNEQLNIFKQPDQPWAEFSNDIHHSVVELIATLLLQIVRQSRTNQSTIKPEDRHAR